MTKQTRVAYFSMEIALENSVPTYSGGLGVLAGDTIRSAADLGIPLVAVTLLHRKGYFRQSIDLDGRQEEAPDTWALEDTLTPEESKVSVRLEDRTVHVGAWRYQVQGQDDHSIPVVLLDTNLPENSDWDRSLSDRLYGGDQYYRLCQEIVLGIGGVRMLRALGYENLERFHMNEGHASFLTLEVLHECAKENSRSMPTHEDVEMVRRRCIFTTHTPVPAGHDRFPISLVERVLEYRETLHMREVFCCEGEVNMTFVGFNLSHFINGVAKKHGAVSQSMFPNYQIDWITNGVHATTWAAEPVEKVFDRYINGWRTNNSALRYALNIPEEELWTAHQQCKSILLEHVKRETGVTLAQDVLTIGYARRATAYKRPALLFQDRDRLREIVRRSQGIQVIYSGKAHPADQEGKKLIQRIVDAGRELGEQVRVVYLSNYNMDLARIMVSGSDVWLNTPRPPLEASGTSGMKAALNGVPSLSVPDGWWLEGCIEGRTGWAIDGERGHIGDLSDEETAEALYRKLEEQVLPLYYSHRGEYVEMMRHCIALNGSFFTTERMMREYVLKAYFL